MTARVLEKKELQVPAEIMETLMSHFTDAQRAKEEGKPVVWSSLLIPKEIYQAMDVSVIYFELYALVLAKMGLSGHYCGAAEEGGVSRDVCAAHRCFIGCATAEEREPILESIFTPPDLIVGGTFPCMSESKSFFFAANRFNCPYIFLDTPLNPWGEEIPDHAIEYYASELKGLINFLGDHGYKLDWEKLKETVELSRQLMVLWDKVDDYRKVTPTPLGAEDALWCSFATAAIEPKRALELIERLCGELKERVENKIGVVEEEKLRLHMQGVPTIYDMGLLNYPGQYGAVFVKNLVEFVCIGAVDSRVMDPEKPLESLARKLIIHPINPPFTNMINFTTKIVKEFHIDGVVSVVKRTCGIIPAMARPIKDGVYGQTGIPSILFDLDGIDTRERDDATLKTNIDSFIETLLASKRRS